MKSQLNAKHERERYSKRINMRTRPHIYLAKGEGGELFLQLHCSLWALH